MYNWLKELVLTKARERGPLVGCSRCWPHAVGREAGPKGSWGTVWLVVIIGWGLSVVAYSSCSSLSWRDKAIRGPILTTGLQVLYGS